MIPSKTLGLLAWVPLLAGTLVLFTGCSGGQGEPGPKDSPADRRRQEADEILAERALLSAEDRALVEAQEWCVVSTGQRLGSMGPPVKLQIKGQPVFLCCKRRAEADPEKTLATLDRNKARKRSETTK